MAADASEAIKAIDSDGSNPNNENVLKWMFLEENEDLRNNKKLQKAKSKYTLSRERRGYCLTCAKWYMTRSGPKTKSSQQKA